MILKRKRQQIMFTEPSKTKQAFKDECDVNQILAKYQKTQLLTHVNNVKGNYGDFSGVSDYQSALNAVMDANDRFNDLPAQIRAEFSNDPGQFMEFVSNESNYEKALNLGLLDDQKAKAYLDAKAKKSNSTPPSNPNPGKDTPS